MQQIELLSEYMKASGTKYLPLFIFNFFVNRNNLQTVDSDGPEQAEKEQLERSYIEAMEELKAKKSVLEGLNVTTMRMEEQYQEQLRLEEQILNAWKEKDQQATEIDKDLRDQEEKLSRAEKQLKRLIRDIRGTQNTKFQTLEEVNNV